MTEKELKEKIIDWLYNHTLVENKDRKRYANQIIKLFREAGYISPSEFENKLQERMYQEYNSERYKP